MRLLLTSILLLLSAPAFGQITHVVTDPSAAAANRAQIDVAQNGNTPIVNITAPNAAGLSHNKFLHYNVDEHGLILNNINQVFGVSSLVGGQIVGNPNLQGGESARIILTEVTGTSQSTLRGITEVAGAAAQLILANPNGIYADGAGFINTPRVTLTTGTLYFNGNAIGFDVNDGTIIVAGRGIDTGDADAFDIISRAARIAANIHTDGDLNIVTGRNKVDYATLTATPKTDDGSDKPTVAIDSSALGGMYANRIRLVATEKGVGVNLQGRTSASAGSLFARAAGKVRVRNATATGNLTVQSTGTTPGNNSVEVEQVAYGGGDLNLSATGDVNIAADAVAGSAGSNTLSGDQVTVASGAVVGASLNANGVFAQAARNLEINATTAVKNEGQIVATGDLTVATVAFENLAHVVSGGVADVTADSVVFSDTSETEVENLVITSTLFEAHGDLVVTDSATLTVTDFLQSGSLTAGSFTSESDSFQNDGIITVADAFSATTGTFSQDAAAEISAGELSLTTTATAPLNLTGRLEGGSTLAIQSASDTTLTGEAVSFGTATLTAPNLSVVAGGRLAAEDTITLNIANALENAGAIESENGTSIQSASFHNAAGGLLFTEGALTMGSMSGSFLNEGELDFGTTGGSTSITANTITNAGPTGVINTTGELVFATTGGDLDLQSGSTLRAAGFTGTSAGALLQNSDLQSPGQINLTAQDDITLGGTTNTDTGLSLTTSGDIANTSDLYVTGNFGIAAGNLTNTAALATSGDLSTQLTGDLTNSGTLLALGSADLRADGAVTNSGAILADGDVNVSAVDGGRALSFTNSPGAVLESWGGDVTIRAETIDNLGNAPVIERNRVLIDTQTQRKTRDYLLSPITAPSRIRSSGDLTLDFQNGRNYFSEVSANGDIDLLGGTFTNSGDTLYERNETLRIDYNGYLTVKSIHGHFYVPWKVQEDRLHEYGWSVPLPEEIPVGSYGYTPVEWARTTTEARRGPSGAIEFTEVPNPVPRSDKPNHPYWGFLWVTETPGAPYEKVVTSSTVTQTSTVSGTIEAGGNITGTLTGAFSNLNGPLNFTAPGTSFSTAISPDDSRSLQALGSSTSGNLVFGNPLASLGGLGRLFSGNPGTQVQYLYETNNDFIDLNRFVGSDYFFERVPFPGGDYEATPKRLGDSYFETNYVNQQLFALTGRRFVSDDINSDYEQMQHLLDNALDAQSDLNLRPGVALSEEQFNRLNEDIVWMVEKQVGNETVLEPVLYLSRPTVQRISGNGASLMAGGRIELNTGDITNSGSLRSENDLTLNASGDVTNRGALSADETMNVTAGGDITNDGGLFEADAITFDATRDLTFTNTDHRVEGDLTLKAGRDLTFSTVEETTSFWGTTRQNQIGNQLEVGGDFTATAGRDLTLTGSFFDVEGTGTFKAGRDLTIAAAEQTLDRGGKTEGKNWSVQHETRLTGSVITGTNLTFKATNDINVTASELMADESLSLNAENDINILSAEERSEFEFRRESGKSGLFSKKKTAHEIHNATTQVGSLLSGGTVSLTSGNDTNIIASVIDSENLGSIDATGDIRIGSAANTFEDYSKHTSKSWLFKSSATDQVNLTTQTGSVVQTQLGNLTLKSGKDTEVQGSSLFAGGDLTITAEGDLTFSTAIEEVHESHEYFAKGFTFSGGSSASGFSVGINWENTRSSSTFDGIYNVGSTANADGAVIFKSGNDATFTGARLGSGGDLSIEAKGDVNFLAAYDSEESTSSYKSTNIGLTLSAGSGIAEGIAQLGSGIDLLSRGGGEAEETGVLAGGLRTINGATKTFETLNALGSGGSLDDFTVANVGLTLSFSKTKSSSEDSSHTAFVTAIDSAGNISIVSNQDITFTGTQVTADDAIEVDADGDITFLQALSTAEGNSQSKSIGANIGLGFSIGGPAGVGVTAGGNFSKSSANYDQGVYTNTVLDGSSVALAADGSIIRHEDGVDWSNQEESSMSTGDLSLNLGTFGPDGSFNAAMPWWGVDGRRTSVRNEGTIFSLNDSVFSDLGASLFGPGSDLANAFSSAGQSAYSSLINGLLYSPESELENVWNNAAFSGVSAFGSTYVGHGPLEGVWNSSNAAQLTLKPLLHAAVQGAVAEAFGYEFSDGAIAGATGSLAGMLARELGTAYGWNKEVTDYYAQQFAVNLAQAAVGLSGGDYALAALIGENVWEYNDLLETQDRLDKLQETLAQLEANGKGNSDEANNLRFAILSLVGAVGRLESDEIDALAELESELTASLEEAFQAALKEQEDALSNLEKSEYSRSSEEIEQALERFLRSDGDSALEFYNAVLFNEEEKALWKQGALDSGVIYLELASEFIPVPVSKIKYLKDVGKLDEVLKKSGAEIVSGSKFAKNGFKATCFEAGTLVKAKHGIVPIESIKPGHQVWSRNEKTGTEGWQFVGKVFQTEPSELIRLEIACALGNSAELVGTAAHRIWSDSRGRWVYMNEMVEGELLRVVQSENEPNALARVVEISAEAAPAYSVTYNFSVSNWETYFVAPKDSPPTASLVWVHNSSDKTCEQVVSGFQRAIASGRIDKVEAIYEKNRSIMNADLRRQVQSLISDARNFANLNDAGRSHASAIKKEVFDEMRGQAGQGKHMGGHGAKYLEAARRIRERAKQMKSEGYLDEVIDAMVREAKSLEFTARTVSHKV